MRRCLAGAALCLSLGSVALAQVPAGPELAVNTYTTQLQSRPRVALDPAGRFVVVWHSPQDGSQTGVFGQRFSPAGARLGAEFQANTYTTSTQSAPEVAFASGGRFTVAWGGYGTPGQGILAQRFDAAGQRTGGEFLVSEDTTYAAAPSLSSAGRDAFVIAWQGQPPGDDFSGIDARRFDAAGTTLGSQLRVNTYTTGAQAVPSLSAGPDGRFVVSWMSVFQDGSGFGIFGQRFDTGGRPLGTEFQVNTYTSLSQSFPAAALAGDGSFVVAWTGYDPDGTFLGVFAQRFDPSGVRRGAEFRVDGETAGSASDAAAAAADDGSFVVAWTAAGGPGDPNIGVFGRRFTAQGDPRGAEFRVNTYLTSFQVRPHVASDAHGNFVVTWESSGQDGSSYGVFAQRFGGLRPVALAVDESGNRVWEPGETAAVAPSWINTNGAALAFGGTLPALAGPAGATYTITDGTADYGTVADGATAACADCYGVAVTDPPTRPALHWDASASERIVPDALGQYQRWTLHVGRSFPDVDTGSPYYRFIETILHQGATGGCGGGGYCPGSGTTREQMAAFVLVAREGPGYLPPACTTPVFEDVPASSPFCRFVEELVRRGVVIGCAPGRYCPAAPISREQMAVFVLRTLEPALEPPPCAPPNVFEDVPETSPFCRWVEELFRRGVVIGCAPGRYCPTATVTREQMAVFISVGFSLTLYGP